MTHCKGGRAAQIRDQLDLREGNLRPIQAAPMGSGALSIPRPILGPL